MLSGLEFEILKLEELDSTNDYCKTLATKNLIKEGLIIQTDRQTKGRGYTGSWENEPHKNLTFSLYIEPRFLNISQSYLLNLATSLSVLELINPYQSASIKWPNDILCEHRKICGILIENNFNGNHLESAIIGIGINVNQTQFQPFQREATSLKLEQGKELEIDSLLKKWTNYFQKYYLLLQSNPQKLINLYHTYLYLRNQESVFEVSGQSFKGILKGIDNNGFLKVQNLESKTIRSYQVKEIKFLE